MYIYGVIGKEESKERLDFEGKNWEILFGFLREM